MIDDLTKTIKAQLYERATSPLLGAFALSWVAWNYRFVLVLISSMPVAEKIAYIDATIFTTWQDIVLRGSIYPLGTSALMIFGYPYPAKFVYEFWRNRQRELKEIQQKIDDETPLTKVEALKIKQEARELAEKYEYVLEKRAIEIDNLKKKLDMFGDSNKEAENKDIDHNDYKTDEMYISYEQLSMLKNISETDEVQTKRNILSNANDKVIAEYDMNELLDKNLINSNYSSKYGDYVLKPTPIGLKYIVENKNRIHSS